MGSVRNHLLMARPSKRSLTEPPASNIALNGIASASRDRGLSLDFFHSIEQEPCASRC